MLRAHNLKRRLIAGVSEAFDDIEGGTEEVVRQVLAGHVFSAAMPNEPKPQDHETETIPKH